MAQFTTLTGRVALLPVDNVDTDQIIPARFLKTTSKAGLGEHLFADWRYRANGSPRPEFVLNDPISQGAKILLTGDNFGCGSSREHAPWALLDYGFRAVISTSFADIFRNNCLKNGLLPVTIDPETHAKLVRMAKENPGLELNIDLNAQVVRMPDGTEVPFPIDAFSKNCLLKGSDELGYLLEHLPEITAFESAHG